MRSRRIHSILVAAALAALAVACARDAPERPPNVVLLVLDTVRADHVGCYGYTLATTPHIDELAASADRYARAESTAPWTLPSHASMFTGRPSFQHGAEAERLPDGRILDARPLAESHVTLAEALRDAGYQTAAFIANNVYLSVSFGCQQGFEIYAVDRQRAGAMNDKLFAWLERVDRDRPFLAVVNYMDAHRPYNVEPLPGGARPGLPPPAAEQPIELLDELRLHVLAREEPPDPELVRKVISQYDQGVAWADWAVGQVVDELRSRGLLDETLLIVTSDHGEYFGEHDLAEHSKDVYQEAIAVPLVVKRPGQSAGRVVAERASLADLPGLVFSELPGELRELHGAPFAAPSEQRPVLAEIRYTRRGDLEAPWRARFMRERHALFAGRYKFILSSDGAHELYDLEGDPREQENLAPAKPALAEALEARLRALLALGPATDSDAPVPELTPAQLDELRQLGYL